MTDCIDSSPLVSRLVRGSTCCVGVMFADPEVSDDCS